MKHHLSSIRRSPWLSVILLVILGFMLCPVGLMAASATPVLPIASVGGFNSMLMGSLGAGAALYMGLRATAGEGGDEGGGKGEDAMDPKEALAKVEDKTLPMGQRLAVAVQALKGIDPTNQLADVKKEVTTLKADLATKTTELQAAQNELASVKKELAAREVDIKALETSNAALETQKAELEAKEKDVEKRADAKAKEKVASLGFQSNKLPGTTEDADAEVPQSRDELEQALKKCETATERREMLQAWRKQQEA